MNRVVIAVAGAGKTEEIAELISSEPDTRRTLLLTYTERNQREDASRIAAKLGADQKMPDVTGWFSFLINHVVRPYLPTLFPGIELRGLGMDPKSFRGLSGPSALISPSGDAYPSRLSLLAVKVMKASGSSVIDRLEHIYDALYVDEGQDLCGNDLEVIRALMGSKLRVTIVMDPRQAVLQTSARDQKHKGYRHEKVALYYRELERRGICSIGERLETHRFTPDIAALSDAIIPVSLGFGATVSKVVPECEHAGVFVVQKDDAAAYARAVGATVLRVNRSTGSFDGLETANFGECKGMQRDHVVVIATTPIEEVLLGKRQLEGKSLCGFYVAVTRARFSVAIAVRSPQRVLSAMGEPGSAFASVPVAPWKR